MTDNTQQLAPCAHCGAKATERYQIGRSYNELTAFFIQCTSCGVTGPRSYPDDFGNGKEPAITAWNPRAIPAAMRDMAEALAWYGEQFCELGASHECCGKMSDDDCAGCKARTALASYREGGAA